MAFSQFPTLMNQINGNFIFKGFGNRAKIPKIKWQINRTSEKATIKKIKTKLNKWQCNGGDIIKKTNIGRSAEVAIGTWTVCPH